MISFDYKSSYDVNDFREIMKLLRSEDGCPWDREQTHESIRRNLLEEAYETCEAIDEGDSDHLKEELGDLLMQVIFHALIEEEAGGFGLDDVADAACRKLIARHPHVFGSVEVSGADEVLDNWDEIKRRERSQQTIASAMDGITGLPALWRADKIQRKAAKAGFDWPDVTGALGKLEEELRELREAVSTGEGVQEELGDVLFSAVNISRFCGCDPELALNLSSSKFIRRFRYIEDEAAALGLDLQRMSLDEMEMIYEQGKSEENSTSMSET